jgi:hypothetical protein
MSGSVRSMRMRSGCSEVAMAMPCAPSVWACTLRGERDHCKMVAIPTTKDEDGKRPNRERESLIGEQTRIVNRMKATLIRLGNRGFNPKLKKAAG